jgi:hypothetical protein
MWEIDDGENCDILTEKLEKEWNKVAAEYELFFFLL